MYRKQQIHHFCLLVAGALALGACERGSQPEAQAPTVPQAERGPSVSQMTIQGVHVTARADSWGGDARISSEVTPVRVLIKNDSEASIAIRLRNFELVENEQSYRPLPLHDIEGLVLVDEVAARGSELELAARRALSFKFAPFYKATDPELDTYAGEFGVDEEYLTTFGPEFDMTSLPTETMWRAALPEGVLMPGGYLDGYLYFQQLPGSMTSASFQATFPRAAVPTVVATFDMPVQLEGS